MKKKNVILTFALLMCISFNFVFASTNTQVRTENNLMIKPSIKVTEKVKKAALSTPKVDETEKIYDFANLFTESQENILYNDVSSFINEYDMDMVIVTINDNNKSSSMAYADDFYDYNYFGVGSTNDGLLLLIDMDNRVVWISTTGKAILMYDDARIDDILDYVQDELVDANYYNAGLEFISESKYYAEKGIPSSNSNMTIDKDGNYVERFDIMSYILRVFPIPTIITLVVILIGVTSHRNVKKAVFAKEYLKENTVRITGRQDKFLRSNTASYRISSSSSGSSSSGGSSTHSGSSGVSHGGGGRSF